MRSFYYYYSIIYWVFKECNIGSLLNRLSLKSIK
jgi:hypothetical protein